MRIFLSSGKKQIGYYDTKTQEINLPLELKNYLYKCLKEGQISISCVGKEWIVKASENIVEFVKQCFLSGSPLGVYTISKIEENGKPILEEEWFVFTKATSETEQRIERMRDIRRKANHRAIDLIILGLKEMCIELIFSGGNSGAEYGALKAALEMNIPYYGYTQINKVAQEYSLEEEKISHFEDNIREANVTILFSKEKTDQYHKVAKFSEKFKKQWKHIDLSKNNDEIVKELKEWLYSLQKKKILPRASTINVTGATEKEYPGIEQRVMEIIVNLNSEMY